MNEALISLKEYASSGHFNKYQEKVIESLIEFFEYNDRETISDDDVNSIADSLLDVYDGDLLEWLSDNLNNIYYCNEAYTEFGYNSDNDFDIMKLIMDGQYIYYIDIIYETLRECGIEVE